jgi:hypothetical protein
MQSNYHITFVRSRAAALPQGPILSNRDGFTACALGDAHEPDPMR